MIAARLLQLDLSGVRWWQNQPILKLIFAILFVGILSGQAINATELQPFLETYCIRCHGAEKQKGDRRFDHVTADLSNLENAEAMQEILDQLNLAEMPPEDEKQPSEAELKSMVDWLTASLAKAREENRANAGKVVMRRLNRNEYRNTIRDLFGFEMADFDRVQIPIFPR